MNVPNYSDFGPMGVHFQQFWTDVFDEMKRRFDLQVCAEAQPVDSAFERFVKLPHAFHRSGFWMLNLAQMLSDAKVLSQDALMDLVRLANLSFRPNFGLDSFPPSVVRMLYAAHNLQVLLLREKEFEVQHAKLNELCHGPFSAEEIAYLTANHLRILDAACGSGYLLLELERRGFDAVGFDNHRYNLNNWTAAWQHDLCRRGLLRRGSVELVTELSRDRALLLSFPEPRSAFAANALRVYTEAGGRHFLFKPGGFTGSLRTDATALDMSASTYKNVIAFLEFLAANWVEIEDTGLPHSFLQRGNNLHAFRRKL
jgi:hypothetical protein